MNDYNDLLLSRMTSATATHQTRPVQAQLSPNNYLFPDDIAQPSVTTFNGDGSPSTQSGSFDMLTELNGGGALQSAMSEAATTRVNGSATQTSIFATAVANGGAADLLRPPAVRVGGSSNVPAWQGFSMEDSGELGLAGALNLPSVTSTVSVLLEIVAAICTPLQSACSCSTVRCIPSHLLHVFFSCYIAPTDMS